MPTVAVPWIEPPLAETPAAGSALDLTVDRRTGLSPEAFRREYLYRNRPVVIDDGLRGWRALDRWSPSFFAGLYPSKLVGFRNGTSLRMREFIDQVLASHAAAPAPYWTNAPVIEHFPELLADIDARLPYFRPNWADRWHAHPGMQASLNRGATIEIYIGGAGGSFPVLHWDGLSTHAFLMQIYGVKQYWLWSPDETPHLYPNADVPNTSPIGDVVHPDLDRFPLFAKARGATLTLHPGQLLFVPSRWWHTAKMLTPSITLSINAVNASNWSNFAEDMTRNASGLARSVKRAYLASAGWTNRLLDAMGAG